MDILAGHDAKIGVYDKWIHLIMKCVTMVSYRINVNGEYADQIFPQRGLRQGGPLSPYVFILCAEGLSAMLLSAKNAGKIEEIKICRGGTKGEPSFLCR
jgi:hypothetical protein